MLVSAPTTVIKRSKRQSDALIFFRVVFIDMLFSLITQKADHFIFLRKAADLVFRKYEFAVSKYIKDTIATPDQFCLYAELF